MRFPVTKESYEFVICYYDGNEDILEKVAGTYDELTYLIQEMQIDDDAFIHTCFPIIKAGNVMPASYFIWSSIVNGWVDVTTINHREY